MKDKFLKDGKTHVIALQKYTYLKNESNPKIYRLFSLTVICGKVVESSIRDNMILWNLGG